MGWVFMTTLGGYSTPLDFLDRQFTSNRPKHSYRVLRSALVGMRVYYAAVEHTANATGSRTVFVAVCPVRYDPRARDDFIFGYKIMTEDALPYDRDCPEAILDLLTPTERANAVEWRSACRRGIATRRLETQKPTPRPGQIIVFDRPVGFQDSRSFEQLRVVANPHSRRAVLFRPIDGAGLYRIPNIKRHAYRLQDGHS
jgi:hypothetical protein